MKPSLTQDDLRKISTVLAGDAKDLGSYVRIEVNRPELGRKLALEIYPDIEIGKNRGTLVSVYTPTAHLQLHHCTGYVVSDMLGEVTFVGEAKGKLSGLTVEREGGCSLYANVDRGILSGDFTALGPEVMMSGIALSLTETMLPAGKVVRKKSTGRRPSGRTRVRRGRSSLHKKRSTSG